MSGWLSVDELFDFYPGLANTLVTVHPDQNAPVSERQSSTWDIRNAPKNYLSLIVFQAGSAVFSFAAVWLITEYLGSEGYGGVVAVIAGSQLAQVFVSWTAYGVVRFGVDELIESGRIARVFWLRLGALAVNLGFLIALSPVWFGFLARLFKLTPEVYGLLVAHIALTALWMHVQMSLQGAKLLRLQGLLMMCERLVILLGVAALLWAANLTPNAAVMAYIAGPAAMILIGVFALRGLIFARFVVDRVFVTKFLAYSLPLLPFGLVGVFSGSYVDAAFVVNYLSTRDLGHYSIATQINGLTLQIPTLANTVLFPLFITLRREQEHERSGNYFRNVVPVAVLGWGALCTLVAAAANYVIPVVFDREFLPAAGAVWILLGASVVGLPVAIGYSALSNAMSLTWVAMIGAICSAVANVVGNALLIPRFGLLGCAAASVFAFMACTVAFVMIMKARADTPPSWTFVAFVPYGVGAVIYFYFGSAVLGLVGTLAATLLVALAFRSSLAKAVQFARGLSRF